MRQRPQFTAHALAMLRERGIAREWVEQALESPAQTETRDDGTVHYISPVPEHEGKMLRVVVNPKPEPPQVVTVFFDRRLRRKT